MVFRPDAVLWCFAFHLSYAVGVTRTQTNYLNYLRTEVLLLGDRLTSLEDAAELSVRTPDEIILARYLDDLGLPYVFDVKGLGQPTVATMLIIK